MIVNVIEWLDKNVGSTTLSVNILEDNKYQYGEENQTWETSSFIRSLNKYNFSFDGGGSREFYITIYKENGEKENHFTFQVSPFEYETELELV